MAVPEAWAILLDRRDELLQQQDGQMRMESMLKTQLTKIQDHRRHTGQRVADIESTLRQLGWMEETA